MKKGISTNILLMSLLYENLLHIYYILSHNYISHIAQSNIPLRMMPCYGIRIMAIQLFGENNSLETLAFYRHIIILIYHRLIKVLL